ncbi:hypothetical protein JOD02_000457 [Caldicoprobacter guelmensis]|nr:hypothetical protein [Caldicoprobacter guelmensis]MBM7581634.1 hypothetical protein [Caldicoprobacter guelmensis]
MAVRTIVLAATVVYELVGAVIAKTALQKGRRNKTRYLFMEEGF